QRLKNFDGLRDSSVPRAHQRFSAQELLVRLGIDAAARNEPLTRFQPQWRLQRLGNGLSDVFLRGKNIAELAVVGVGPEMCAVGGFDELRSDAQARAVLADRSLDQVRRAQGLAHGANVLALALELVCRG